MDLKVFLPHGIDEMCAKFMLFDKEKLFRFV